MATRTYDFIIAGGGSAACMAAMRLVSEFDFSVPASAHECADGNAGTLRMGPEADPMSVVDARLRVCGIDILRVLDCSCRRSFRAAPTHRPWPSARRQPA